MGIKDECGVFGVYNNDKSQNTSYLIYTGLYMLQHRGQEGAGIAVTSGFNQISFYKDQGLVSNIFTSKILDTLQGNVGIGHVRYSTTGASIEENSQPFVHNRKKDSIAIVHNGNIINSETLRKKLIKKGYKFKGTSDTEVLAMLVSNEFIFNKNDISNTETVKAIKNAFKNVKGAYSILLLTNDRLIAIRDPYGIRPLCIGKLDNSYFFSSESIGYYPMGAKIYADVEPGEIIIIDKKGLHSFSMLSSNNKTHSQNKEITKTNNSKCKIHNKKQLENGKFCIFEYVYFARPDTVLEGKRVYSARLEIGKQLFRENPIKDADVVFGVPDSGVPAAIGYSKSSGIEYIEGFNKNRYVGRSFIQPSQKMRDQAVKLKLTVLKEQIEGKNVIITDDSLVRGTTLSRIVKLVKKAGAKKVHILIGCPPVKYSCFYGIDTPHRNNLIASKKNIEEIRKFIGSDSLYFLSINGLKKAPNRKIGFCTACYDGDYIIKPPKGKLNSD